jgi:hypothetical protein
METESTSADAMVHTKVIRQQITDLVDHLRRDVSKVDDVKAKALFETAAEVLTGLRKAFEDYEKKDEEAWKE